MAKLKTYEEFIEEIDSAEEIEKDMMAMGEPESAEDDEDYQAPELGVESDDSEEVEGEDAGEEVEDMESDATQGEEEMEIDGEVVDTEPKDLSGDMDLPEDEVEEDEIPGGLADGMSAQDLADKHDVSLEEIEAAIEAGLKVEVEHTDDEAVALEIAKDHIFEDPKYYDKLAAVEEAEEDGDDVETEIADLEAEEEVGDEEAEDAEDEEAEDEEAEDEEAEEAPKSVEEMLKEVFEACKNEAKVWEEDMHDEHTIESYVKEQTALYASMSTSMIDEMREDLTLEAFEAICNELKSVYSNKIDEVMEVWSAGGEE